MKTRAGRSRAAVEIWAARIETALEMRDRLRQINHYNDDDDVQ